MPLKYAIVALCSFSALLFDSMLSNSRYPILTIIVCAIVLLYEYVSPYIYHSR